MTHQIGRCTAPCVQLVNSQDYRNEVEGALSFLKGQNKKVIQALEKKMHQNAEEEKFEVASQIRDSLRSIKAILEKQNVVNDRIEKDQDAVSFYGDERGCLIETVHARKGSVIGTRSHFFPLLDPSSPHEEEKDWLVSFLNQYYDENLIPDEVLLPLDIGMDMTKLLEKVLEERQGSFVKVRFATESTGRKLVEMASDNAKAHFHKHVSKSEEKKKGLLEIQEKLELPKIPFRIECFDISTFQGAETVASQVVFEEGVPSKDHYRRYKIRTVEGINDFASMTEVLSRRFRHEEEEDPDLLVIDGGKGQLSMAIRILSDLKKEHIPVVGLAKSRVERDFKAQEVHSTEERFFLPGRQNPVTFKVHSEAFYILTGIRDEAHRFAINYHRKLREASTLESELDYVVGLGSKRKQELLKKFQSVDEIRRADPDEIAQIRGFHRVLAERILLQLNQEVSESEDDA
jgi:excinuclease ABC subunit C